MSSFIVMLVSRAFRADAEKLEFVIEVAESGFFADFVFEFVDRAGGFDRFDRAARGADQIVAMFAGDLQSEVGSAFVKAEAAHDAVSGKALQQAKNRGLVALRTQARRSSEFGQCHWTTTFQQRADKFLKRLSASQSCFAALCDDVLNGLVHLLHIKISWIAAHANAKIRKFSKQLALWRVGIDRGWCRDAKFFISRRHGHATAWGAHEVTLHDEERLVHFLDGCGIFADRDSK